MTPETWSKGLQKIKAISGRKFDDEDAELIYGELRDLGDQIFESALHRYLRLEPLPRNLVMYFTQTCAEIHREEMRREENRFESGVQSGEVSTSQHTHFWNIVMLALKVYRFTGKYHVWHEGFAGNWNSLNDHYLDEYLLQEEQRLRKWLRLRKPQEAVSQAPESTQEPDPVVLTEEVPF